MTGWDTRLRYIGLQILCESNKGGYVDPGILCRSYSVHATKVVQIALSHRGALVGREES